MPQSYRAPDAGRLRVADGVDQVRFNRALQVENGPMSFKEFDTVVMKADMPSHELKSGDVGAVVHVYSADAIEVEFVTVTTREF